MNGIIGGSVKEKNNSIKQYIKFIHGDKHQVGLIHCMGSYNHIFGTQREHDEM